MRVPAVYQMTGFSSVMHLLVDGICVCCMYLMASSFSDTHILGIFLLYNVLAFLSQPFTGMWADRMERKHWMLLVSAVLLTLAVLATSVVMNVEYCSAGMPVVAALLGVGNSLFHVWGGRQVAVGTGNNIRALGVFVATGAFGLSLGMVFFSWPLLYLLLISFCLLAVACLNADEPETSADAAKVNGSRFSSAFVLLAVTAIMAVVMLRSFVSESFSAALPKNSTMLLMAGALSMLGKMAGGWMAHWLGIVRMIVLVMVILAVCFLFRGQGTMVLLAALFVVNCTMPVTLYLANVVLPGREGLSFGLLAAALMPGYLIALHLL